MPTSRRPATTIDRATSAQSSTAHGCAGAKLVVIEGESTHRWQVLVNACPREFQPETDIGTELVNEIAAARSGTRRCWLPETSLFEMEIAKQRENVEFEPQDYESQHAAAARDLGQNMRLMDRYETRMRRSYERAVEIPTSSALAPTTENFQTNPRISANNPQA